MVNFRPEEYELHNKARYIWIKLFNKSKSSPSKGIHKVNEAEDEVEEYALTLGESYRYARLIA